MTTHAPIDRIAAIAERQQRRHANPRRVHLHVVPAPHARTLPATRADCIDGPRPCALITCRHHLYVVSLGERRLHVRLPHLPIEEALLAMSATCSLDVVDEEGGMSAERVGALMGLSKQAVLASEVEGLASAERAARRAGLGT